MNPSAIEAPFENPAFDKLKIYFMPIPTTTILNIVSIFLPVYPPNSIPKAIPLFSVK